MSQRFYIHIGLPKTATTTLQQNILPAFCNENQWHYAGVQQPRKSGSGNSVIYRAFMNGMYSGDENLFFDALKSNPHRNVPIIISEEMITVLTHKSTWKENLQNIRRMLVNSDYRVLVTLREPLAASFSFYLERYEYFHKQFGKFGFEVLESEDMAIYRYASFIDYLQNLFGADRVYVATFENIVKSKCYAIEKFLGHSLPKKLSLGVNNSRNRKHGKVLLNQKRNLHATVAQLVTQVVGDGRLREVAKSFGEYLQPSLSRIRWDSSVPLLSEKESEEFKAFLGEDQRILDRYL